MRKIFYTVSLLVLISQYAIGQNIERKGFYFSIGMATNLTNYKLNGEFSKPDGADIYYGSNWLGDINSDNISGDLEKFPFSKSSFGLGTNFNLGYGITNQLVVSFMNRVTFVPDDILHGENYIYHYENPPALTLAGLTGLEFDYYFSENIKSPYLSVGSGMSVLNQPGVSDYLTQTGYGLSIGGGYQFTKHLCLEVNLLYLNGNLQNKIKDEIEALNNGIHIEKSFRSISFGVALKYVLF